MRALFHCFVTRNLKIRICSFFASGSLNAVPSLYSDIIIIIIFFTRWEGGVKAIVVLCFSQPGKNDSIVSCLDVSA